MLIGRRGILSFTSSGCNCKDEWFDIESFRETDRRKESADDRRKGGLLKAIDTFVNDSEDPLLEATSVVRGDR